MHLRCKSSGAGRSGRHREIDDSEAQPHKILMLSYPHQIMNTLSTRIVKRLTQDFQLNAMPAIQPITGWVRLLGCMLCATVSIMACLCGTQEEISRPLQLTSLSVPGISFILQNHTRSSLSHSRCLLYLTRGRRLLKMCVKYRSAPS